MKTQGPPTLGTFWLRQNLWQRIGMKLEEFQELPWKEANEYVFYLQLISQEEAAQQQRNQSRARK